MVLLRNGPGNPGALEVVGFHLYLVQNYGTAGGYWLGESTRILNIVSMSFVIALAAVISPRLSIVHGLAPVALGLIIGAAAGNTLSLILRPGVVDFIAYELGAGHIVFNIADIAVAVGILALAPVAVAIISQARATARMPITVPARSTTAAYAAKAVQRRPVFEREVPLAMTAENGSGIAKTPATDKGSRVDRGVIHEKRAEPGTDIRA
jgi:lipoprotein signal peptidase